jgi:hypothetical protein
VIGSYDIDVKDDELIHVVPQFGREHVASKDCWCKPRQDDEEPRVFIHEPEH